jgi:biotin operon repressor
MNTATYPFLESCVDKRPPVSHETAILARLLLSEGHWVSLPALSAYTEQRCKSRCYVVHSRIASLRERGHDIENKVEQEDGRVMSFYRLKFATGDAQA